MASKLKSYEKKYSMLEEIVKNLDDNTLSLDQMLDQYKKGLTFVKECTAILENVEEEVNQIIEEVRVK